MHRILFPICVCLWMAVAGCASPSSQTGESPDQLTLGKVQGEIKIGMSSAEVVEVLGSPNMVTTDDQRRENWVYDRVSTQRMNASSSSYGTLIIFGASSDESTSTTTQRTLTIIIKFDDDKKVRDFGYNYTQF